MERHAPGPVIGAALLSAALVAPAALAETVIIYARADAAAVQPLRDIARAIGPTWSDVDLRPGDPWRATVARRVCAARTVLLAWSVSAARSVEVAAEWRHALSCRRRLVPVLLDGEPLTGELATLQAIDTRRAVFVSPRGGVCLGW